MKVPIEFTEDFVEENSPHDKQIYRDFLRSGEPFRSIMKNNPWLMPPDIKKPLEWGTGMYWDTTVARKHDYWKEFAPTYPLGVFPCKEGWIGLTVLTPSQWHAFCKLLNMEHFAFVPEYQTSLGRLQDIDTIEPVIQESLLTFSANDLFYKAQQEAIPLARVPTMEELLEVDQFVERDVFTSAILSGEQRMKVPSVPFRLMDTPPSFGGYVAELGEHSERFNR